MSASQPTEQNRAERATIEHLRVVSDDELQNRVERAKVVLRHLTDVHAMTYDRIDVAEQARRVDISEDRVRWMQRVLGLRNGRMREERAIKRAAMLAAQ